MHATQNRQVKFKDPVSSSEVYAAAESRQNENEDAGNWGPGSSPYPNTVEDPNSSYSPYLQPVPEEPSSSFSEGNLIVISFCATCLAYMWDYDIGCHIVICSC